MTDAVQIDANVRSLRRLFTDTNYLIDNYQREYAWSQDDVQILIDDLWEGFEGQNGHPAETFFLGPFVYVQQDQTSRAPIAPAASLQADSRTSSSPRRGKPTQRESGFRPRALACGRASR